METLTNLGINLQVPKFKFWLPSIKKMTHEHPISDIPIKGSEWEGVITLQCVYVSNDNIDCYVGDIIDLNGYRLVIVVHNGNATAYHPRSKKSRLLCDCYKFSILGNVFENPELLD